MKRYELTLRNGQADMVPCGNGDYVRFDEHAQSDVERLAEIEHLKDTCQVLQNRIEYLLVGINNAMNVLRVLP